MTLVKWTPRPKSIFNDMESMVRTVFNDDWNFPTMNMKQWTPAVDVEEKDKSFHITADIPGLTKKDVKVNITNGILTISGERNTVNESENDHYHYRERRHGSFSRSFNLPETVKEDDVSASFKNGILAITLPKHEEVLPKEKEIKIS